VPGGLPGRTRGEFAAVVTAIPEAWRADPATENPNLHQACTARRPRAMVRCRRVGKCLG
jgi:hypothetical protein